MAVLTSGAIVAVYLHHQNEDISRVNVHWATIVFTSIYLALLLVAFGVAATADASPPEVVDATPTLLPRHEHRDATPEQQAGQALCLPIVVNAIVAWNTYR